MSETQESIQLVAEALAREKKKTAQVDQLKKLLSSAKEKYLTLISHLQQKQRELEEENQQLMGQITALKKQPVDEHRHLLEQELALEQEELRKLLTEKSENGRRIQQLQFQLKEKTDFEAEIARIRQTLLKAVRESQELKIHHQTLMEEKIAFVGKWRQAQYQIEKEKEQQEELLQKLEQTSKVTSDLSSQVAHWQQQCLEEKGQADIALKSQGELLQQRDDAILDLQRQVGLLRHEGEKGRDQWAALSNSLAEKERDLIEAKQHLARKVKEVTEFEIHCETKQRQAEELQQIHTQDIIKIAELQANCEMHTQQQKRLQEQLQEAIKAYDNQQTKWEEKYLAIHEKWQMAENRIKELEKLEERYNQLQGLLTNVGNVLNVPPPQPKQENLFDIPKPPRSSHNLF